MTGPLISNDHKLRMDNFNLGVFPALPSLVHICCAVLYLVQGEKKKTVFCLFIRGRRSRKKIEKIAKKKERKKERGHDY
jgi:hypothetical protein